VTPLQTVFRHPFRRSSDCLQTASHTHPLIPPERLKASERPPLRAGYPPSTAPPKEPQAEGETAANYSFPSRRIKRS
jgi:hypothetical protein